jgi:UDP-N-acetylglucosamine acyltransferase
MIDPRAVIHPGAQLGAEVSVGPFSIIGPNVSIGPRTVIGPHAVIDGHTRMGTDNKVSPFASLGGPPQDKKYAGEPTRLEIGDRNVFRECCTVNRGTTHDKGVTRIGDDNLLMAYSHIAHDCIVGNKTVFANCASLGGHVEIGDWVIIGGLAAIHQFVKVGAHAMVGFATAVSQDVPPYMLVDGNPMAVRGFNAIGLKRRGFDAARLAAVKQMHRLLYRQGRTLEDARSAIDALEEETPEAAADIALMSDFLAASTRGIAR